jgi:PAS domain S-box-containing protein
MNRGSGTADVTTHRRKGARRAGAGRKSRTTSHATPAPARAHERDPPPELRLLYDTAPIGLAFLSPDCRYLQINQRLTEICGIPVDGHIGRSVRETVPMVADQVETIVGTILKTGEPITGVEVNGQQPDGSNAERFWLTSWHPLRDPGGAIIGINVVAEEITERKRAQAALAASEARFRELAATLERRVEVEARERARIWNVSHELLVVADADGTFRNVNPAWTSTLGWSPAELIAGGAEWLVHPDDLEKTRAEHARIAAGHRTLNFENRLRHKDGSFRWLSWTAVHDAGQMYGVARDVTELKDAELALRSLRQELARASRQTTLGAMTASIAHEINQPLSAIMMNANAALRFMSRTPPTMDEANAALHHLVEDGRRASQVIRGIRAMFGAEQGEMTELDLGELIRQVVAVADSEMERQQVSARLELRGALPRVMGDRVPLQQVFLNLIMNAIEAMTPVTDRARVLSVHSNMQDAQDVLIRIEDNGIGIDPGSSARIFDAFFTTKSSGMGLGLAICKSIIESHGGRLWASPAHPHGCAFHVVLPVAGADGVA